MQNFEDNLAGRIGGLIRPLPGVSITVTDSNGQPALLFRDDGVTSLAQPLVTDANGWYGFYAPNGRYTLTFTGSLINTFTRSVELYDVDEAKPVTAAELAATSGAAKVGATGGKTVQQEIDELRQWDADHVLKPATTDALGGMIVGDGMTVDGSGRVSVIGLNVASVNGQTPDGAGAIVLNTDNLPEGGAPTNQWFTAARVRAVALAGLSTATNAVIAATDSVLAALGKLQAQVSANATAIGTKQDASAKDASGGFAGLTGFSINLKNAAGTVISTLVSAATAPRTWTFPDKSGTVAMTSDISAAAPAFTKYVQTADQTITGAGALTIAHGLGVEPKLVQCLIRCQLTELGYAVGDVTFINSGVGDVSGGKGVSVTFDETNLYIRYATGSSSCMVALNKATGVAAGANNSNWKFFIRAAA